jgi:DNA-binding MarR family transcriptional regulator
MSKPVRYLKRTYIVMRKVLDERLAKHNLTTSQFEVLGYLYQTEGLEQQHIQQCSGITPATLTGLLDKLEARGLITRRPSRSDGRANFVVLTPQGNELFAQLIDLVHEFENDMLKGFSQAERSLLTEWLQRIALNLGDSEYGLCD